MKASFLQHEEDVSLSSLLGHHSLYIPFFEKSLTLGTNIKEKEINLQLGHSTTPMSNLSPHPHPEESNNSH